MELPEETRQFLAQLRDDDIDTLKDGLRLVIAVRTVGTFMKWVIISVVGTIIGFVMLWENLLKLLKFFKE
ncbi:hypothetical protein MRS76_11180 [Rhizobiaceae bacterium n13]|uniref:hypothetical protein n=1 Tax=Ferirhizobium litorale TaxID=2927786 RepID=UPI0024B2BB9C|nr:hypothetical protein [Fererhizobium litorale]MDI7862523.1 hypothetical protein [Fererhizobium litorale]